MCRNCTWISPHCPYTVLNISHIQVPRYPTSSHVGIHILQHNFTSRFPHTLLSIQIYVLFKFTHIPLSILLFKFPIYFSSLLYTFHVSHILFKFPIYFSSLHLGTFSYLTPKSFYLLVTHCVGADQPMLF